MRNLYSTPLNSRYASKEMSFIFSDDMKFTTWRKLWVALAEGEKELGLNITDEQIKELKEHINDINYDDAINDILKKINWETKDEQVYQSLAIVYMPNENANKIFSEFDESNQEDDYGIDIDNTFVYAYVDLIDMQIRYNYDCVFFADERSL